MNLVNSIAILFVFLTCILTNANSQNRIIGGINWDIEKSPYVVVIRYQEHYRCVGTIISMRRVLTSLWCFQIPNFVQSYIRVTAGKSNLYEEGVDRSAELIIRPCDAGMVEIDIAVIALDKKLSVSLLINAIALCETELNPGVKLRVSGWGATNADIVQPSKILQSAELEIFPINQCAGRYADFFAALKINFPKTAICLIDQALESDMCTGDAGAPAVAEGKLYAVLAGRIPPLNRLDPTIFTSICNNDVKDFIKYAMQRTDASWINTPFA